MTMPEHNSIPRRTVLGEKVLLSLADGSTEVLKGMAADAEFETVAAYLRGLVEREISMCRPEDFKRLRGVA